MTIVTRLLFVFLLFSVTAASTNAAHVAGRVDRSDLDDDIVESFPIPVLFGVVYDDLVPDFADPRDGGLRSHEGQDMRAPLGTPIVSPTEAIVISTGEGASAGKYVYTANPGGETFRYMHLDTIADLDRGDRLDVGDFIGTVGDTGNAPAGIYHLHLEVRDEDNDPTDPYERFSEDGFTLREQISAVRQIMREVRNEEEYATFLVETFPDVFMAALEKKYDLPNEIEDILEESGADERVELIKKLDALIQTIPSVLPVGLGGGDSGTAVSLLQTYLIYTQRGSARDRLAEAGATGYFGTITADALREYQAVHTLPETGAFDAKTRTVMQ